MDLEWDPKKAAANRLKQGIDLADAATVLHDDLGRLLIVVFPWRDRRIHLISARRANSHKRARYEERR